MVSKSHKKGGIIPKLKNIQSPGLIIHSENDGTSIKKNVDIIFDNINKKMDKILEQHDKIADGIVAIADLVKQMKEENQIRTKREAVAPRPKPVAPSPTAPILPEATPPRMAPPTGMGEGTGTIQGRPPFISPQ